MSETSEQSPSEIIELNAELTKKLSEIKEEIQKRFKVDFGDIEMTADELAECERIASEYLLMSRADNGDTAYVAAGKIYSQFLQSYYGISERKVKAGEKFPESPEGRIDLITRLRRRKNQS